MTNNNTGISPSTPSFPPSRTSEHKNAAATNKDRLNELDDKRIVEIKPLIPPQILVEDYPLCAEAAATISMARQEAEAIIKGEDDRILVIVGPCSIHDVTAAKEYAAKLSVLMQEVRDSLCIVMRVYFEKPRTTVGWKGLINDPEMDGTFAINKGLKVARSLLLELNRGGIPTGCEFLDTLTPQYIGDLVAWGAIGARTTESQVHRELASGLSCPVGFKNGTDGNVGIAVDAMRAAASPHHFLSVTKQGISAIVATSGNDSCHVILRGSNSGPNYEESHVQTCIETLKKASSCNNSIMVDCSHGNSQKQHARQLLVIDSLIQQIQNPTSTQISSAVMGVMIESNLVEGRQNIDPVKGKQGLVYGQSITDACIGWEDTEVALRRLADAVKVRRRNRQN